MWLLWLYTVDICCRVFLLVLAIQWLGYDSAALFFFCVMFMCPLVGGRSISFSIFNNIAAAFRCELLYFNLHLFCDFEVSPHVSQYDIDRCGP